MSTTKITKTTGKKKMQLALKDEIDRINHELEKLGVSNEIKYKTTTVITNHETPQNTINIQSITDVSTLLRFLVHYENLSTSLVKYKKEFKIDINIINVNGQLIENIVHDLVLRLKVVTNGTKINNLIAAKNKLMPFLDEESRLFNTLTEVQQLYKEIK